MKSTQNYKSVTFSLHYSKCFCTLLVGTLLLKGRVRMEDHHGFFPANPENDQICAPPLAYVDAESETPCTPDPQLLALGDNETQHLRI